MTAEAYVARDCPECGRVSVRTDRIRRTSTASGAREQWTCPRCGRAWSQNVHYPTPTTPAPPALTEDDLIAFGLALQAAPDAPEPPPPNPAERTQQ